MLILPASWPRPPVPSSALPSHGRSACACAASPSSANRSARGPWRSVSIASAAAVRVFMFVGSRWIRRSKTSCARVGFAAPGVNLAAAQFVVVAAAALVLLAVGLLSLVEGVQRLVRLAGRQCPLDEIREVWIAVSIRPTQRPPHQPPGQTGCRSRARRAAAP